MEKELIQLIEICQQKGIYEVEVYATKTSGFSVSIRNFKKEQQEKHKQQGYQLTVYQDHKSASVDSSVFSIQGLERAAEKAKSLVALSEPDSGIELPPKELMAKKIKKPNLFYQSKISLDEAFKLTEKAEKSILNTKNNVRSDGVGFSAIESESHLITTNGLNYSNQSTQYSINANAIAEDNHSMEVDYEYDIKLDLSDLENPEKIGNQAAKKALRKLESKKIKTLKSPVIFSSEISSSLISHLLGAISGDSQYHQQSFYLNGLNQKIMPEFINIYEQPTIEKSAYSRVIDSEGLLKKEQFFIEKGVIKNYLLNHYTATKLNMKHTANAGGSSNTLVEYENQPSLTDLIHQMDRGLLITSLMGAAINPVTGNYSRGASGFWVENGMIQYPVKKITIAGNLKQMYQNILAVSRDIDVRKSIRVGSILLEEMTIAGE